MRDEPFEEGFYEVFNIGRALPYLAVQIYGRQSRYMYSVRLAPLSTSEEKLQHGRFHQYSPDRQNNRIRLNRDYGSGEELQRWYGAILDWIGDHGNGAWSASVTMLSINSGVFEFSFQNDTTSVAFALIFT